MTNTEQKNKNTPIRIGVCTSCGYASNWGTPHILVACLQCFLENRPGNGIIEDTHMQTYTHTHNIHMYSACCPPVLFVLCVFFVGATLLLFVRPNRPPSETILYRFNRKDNAKTDMASPASRLGRLTRGHGSGVTPVGSPVCCLVWAMPAFLFWTLPCPAPWTLAPCWSNWLKGRPRGSPPPRACEGSPAVRFSKNRPQSSAYIKKPKATKGIPAYQPTPLASECLPRWGLSLTHVVLAAQGRLARRPGKEDIIFASMASTPQTTQLYRCALVLSPLLASPPAKRCRSLLTWRNNQIAGIKCQQNGEPDFPIY